MKQPYNRISEHVLFVLLLAALAAWLMAPVAPDLLSVFAGSLPSPGSAGADGAGTIHREFT